MPDTTPTLRDRIRRAICEASGFTWLPDELMEPDEYGEHADAVLAVLPEPPARLVLGTTDQQPETAPIDRVTVLREAADAALTMPTPDCAEMSSLTGAWRAGLWAAVDCLRRLADEAQQPETEAGSDLPPCGDREHRHMGPCTRYSREPTRQKAQPATDRPDTETEAAK